MRYLARQRLRQAVSLAWQRSAHDLTPTARRLSAFLEGSVDWAQLGVTPGNRAQLATAALAHQRTAFLVGRDDLEWYLRVDPFATHASIVHRADAVCAHRIEVANLGVVDLGAELDWTRDPVTGSRFPTGLFSVRPMPGVDERFRAELSYHRHFPTLALAWLIGRDERYRRELVAQWRSWLDRHPPVDDTFLNDGLETTLRVLCWTHCLSLLGPVGLDEPFCLEVLSRIDAYARLIEKHYRHTPLANNHQVAEGLGQLVIGLQYPALRQAAHWAANGRRVLHHELEAQLLPGGVHAEQSTAYHLFVLECAQMAALLCRRSGVALDPSFVSRLEAATEHLLHLLTPEGVLPALGDDCGLRLWSPTGATGLRPKTALAVGAYLFERADMAAVAGPPDEDVFWFVGRAGVDWLRQAGRGAPPAARTRVLPEAGHAVVRSGWESTSSYLHFDFGPQGIGQRPGHGHDDALSFALQAHGQPLIVDSGTYTYLRSNPLRAYFAGARGHNTIIVDAEDSRRLGTGSLDWQVVAGELIESGAGENLTWLTVRHLGYAGLGIVVERSVLVVHAEYVLLVDRVIGSGNHSVETLFHLAPDVRVSIDGDAVTCQGSRADLRVVRLAPASTWSLHRGADPVQPGWHSPAYGTVVDAPVLRTATRTALPFWQITGLFPAPVGALPQVRLEAGRVEVSTDADSLAVAVEGWRSDGRDQLHLRWDAIASEPLVFVRQRPHGSDEYAYCRTAVGPQGGLVRRPRSRGPQ